MRLIRRLGGPALTLAILACAQQGAVPIAMTGPDMKDVPSGQTVILDGSDSHSVPPGEALTYQWSFVALPEGSQARIESPAQVKTRFTTDVPGVYQVQLSVRTKYYQSAAPCAALASDGGICSATGLQTITVSGCGFNAPTVGTLPALAATHVGVPVSLSAPNVDDKDNDDPCLTALGGKKEQLSYQWSLLKLPAGSRAKLNDPTALRPSFVPDVGGPSPGSVYTVQLVVTDSTGRSSQPATTDLLVTDCGSASPSVDAFAVNGAAFDPAHPPQVNLGQAAQLSATVSDADEGAGCNIKQQYSYQWMVLALPTGSAAQLNGTGIVNPTFVPDVPGDYSFRLVVTDQTNLSSTPKVVTVTARSCGGAPPNPIVSFSPGSVGVGTPVLLHVTPSDDDALCGVLETFSYSWSLLTVPAGSLAHLVNPNGSDASFTPDLGGDYAVQVNVVDSNGTPASGTTHVTVRPCGNNAPSIDKLQGFPPSPLMGQGVHVVPTTSNVDSACPFYNPSQTFRWTLVKPVGSAAALVDPTSSAADFTPDVSGSYQVRLVVTAATGVSSAPAVLSIPTSTCGLSAPTITAAGASTTTPDPGHLVTLFVQPDDVDNSGTCSLGVALSVAWTIVSRPAGSNAALSNPGSQHPTFTPDKVGSYQFEVIASAANGKKSAPSWVTVTTSTCGTSTPTVTAAPANIAVLPNQTVQLTATPSDADTTCGVNETFSYQWQVVSKPAASSAAIGSPTSSAPQFKPDAAGDYQLSVTVADAKGNVSPASFVHVTVASCASLPPLIGSIAPTGGVTLGMPVTMAAVGAMSRNCVATGPLGYQWQLSGKPPASQAMLDNPAAASPSFKPDVAGSYQVQLVVVDAAGLPSAPAFNTVTAASCASSIITWNATPIATVLSDPQGAPAGLPNVGTQVQLSAQFTDSNAGCGLAVTPYTYRWAIVSKPAQSGVSLSSTSAAQPTFVPDVVGAYQVAVQVVDALGTASSAQFLSVNTSSCGTTPPSVDIAPAAPINLNTFDTLLLSVATGSATDADNDTVNNCPARFHVTFTYQWALTASSGATLTTTTGPQTTFQGLASGTYTVQLVATASNGQRSAVAARALNVAACGSHAPQMVDVSTKDVTAGAATSMPPVGHVVSLTAYATDVDSTCPGGDPLQYLWTAVAIPAGSAFPVNSLQTPSAAPLSFTADVAGTYSFQVVAVDSHGLSSAPWPVQVTTAVCAPAWGSATQSLSSNIGDTVSLSVPLAGGNPNVIDTCMAAPQLSYRWTELAAPAGSGAALSSTSGASLTFKPDLIGTYQFQIVAVDQGGFSSSPHVITLRTGTCGTNPPTLGNIAASPTAPNAGDAVSLSVPLTDNNSACAAGKTQPYSYQWAVISAPAHSTAAVSSQGAAPTFVPDLPGTYQLAVRVTDALGNVSNTAFLSPPLQTTTCGANPAVAHLTVSSSLTVAARTPLTLSGNVTNANDTCPARFHTVSSSLLWSVAMSPIGSHPMLSAPTAGSTQFQADVQGNYLVQLVGTTDGVRSAPVPVSIFVSNCGSTAPAVLSVATKVAGVVTSRPAVGSSVTLSASAFDADNVAGGVCAVSQNETLTYRYAVVSLPAGSAVTIPAVQSGSPDFNFTPDVAGTYVFSVVATASSGFSSLPFTVSVPTGPCGPGLTSIFANIPGPTVGQTVSINRTPASAIPDSCAPGTALSFLWSVASRPPTSGAGFANPTGDAPQSFTPDVAGTYVLQLLVTDAGGFSTSAQTTIHAGGCTAGPTLNANPIASAAEPPAWTASATTFRDDTVTLSLPPGAIAQSACGGTAASQYSYEWAMVARPAGSAAQLNSTSSPTPSFVADVPGGTWQVMVIVRDGLGNASSPAFVTVTASSCGAGKAILALTNSTPVSTNSFQAVTLTAAATADPNLTDSNSVACPSRFHSAPFALAWSLAAVPAGSRAPSFTSSGSSATLTPFSPGEYDVKLVATGADGSISTLITPVTANQCGANPPVLANFLASQPARPSMGIVSWWPGDGNTNDIVGTHPGALVNSASFGAGEVGQAFQFSGFDQAVRVPSSTDFDVTNLTIDAWVNPSSVPNPFPTVAWRYSDLVGTGHIQYAVGLIQGPTTQVGCQIGNVVSVNGGNVPLNQWSHIACTYDGATIRTYLNGALVASQSFATGIVAASSSQDLWIGNQPFGTTTNPTLSRAFNGLIDEFDFFNRALSPGEIAAIYFAGAAGKDKTAAAGLVANIDTTLSITPSDADASCPGVPTPSFTYQWMLSAKPAGSVASLSAATAATPHVVPDVGGNYSVQVTVTDDTGLTASNAYSFAVSMSCGSHPPVAAFLRATQALPSGATIVSTAAAPQNLDVSFPVTLDATVGDLDELPLCDLTEHPFSYLWTITAAPAGSRVSLSAPASATPGFAPDLAGDYTLSLKVTDTAGLSSTSSFTVHVTCGAAGPQIADAAPVPAFKATQVVPLITTTTTAVSNFTIVHSTLGAAGPDVNAPVAFYPGVPVSMAANATDGDASCGVVETLAYQWSFVRQPPGSIARIDGAASAAPSFVPDLAGEYDVQLTVSDASGRSATAVFSQLAGKAIVGVSSCGAQLPTAQIGIDLPAGVTSPATVFTTTLVSLNGSSSSTPDNVPLTVATGLGCGLNKTLSYQWSLASEPAGSPDAIGSATSANPTLIPTSDGAYKAQLVVSEGALSSMPAFATINAAQPSFGTSTFTASPTTGIAADGIASSLLTVTAKDSLGNAITAAPVRITALGGAPSLMQGAAKTSTNGVVTATLTSTKSSPPAVVATASTGGLNLPSVSISFVPGKAAKLVFSSPGIQPGTAIQNTGMPTTPRVVIEDANGNPILPSQAGGTNSTVVLSLLETAPAGVVLSFAGNPCPCSVTSSQVSTNPLLAGATFAGLTVNKQGTFHLVANGTSPLSPTVTLTSATSNAFNIVAPAPPSTGPTNVKATGHVQDISLAWDPFPDVNLVGYNVYRAPAPFTTFTKVSAVCAANPAVSACSNSFDDPGLGDGASYAYEVTAVNTSNTSNNTSGTLGEGPFSSSSQAITAPSPPVITNLTPASQQVTVFWNTSPAATSYRVLRSTSSTGPFNQVTTTSSACAPQPCLIDLGLTNGTNYFYQVGAVNSGGEQDSAVAGPVTPVALPDATKSHIALSTISLNPPIADGTTASGAQVLVFVADATGAPINTAPVQMSVCSSLGCVPPPAGDTFTTTTGVTAADGTFLTTLSSTVAETKIIKALVGASGAQITLSLTVDFLGTANFNNLVFSVQPKGVVVGQPFGVVVTARDSNNNPISASGTVTISQQNGPGGSNLLVGGVTCPAAACTVALQSGVANFPNLTVDTAGTNWQLNAAGTVPNPSASHTANSSTFTAKNPPAATAYTAISTSKHSCTIKGNGSLWCFGPNDRGQLGNGTTNASSAPQLVSGGFTDWTAVTTGSNFTCARRSNSGSPAAYCWGANDLGQLGQNSQDSLNHPLPLSVPTGNANTWSSLTAGDFHACGIQSDGTLWCWGSNRNLQAGQGPGLPTQDVLYSGSSNIQLFTLAPNVVAQVFTTVRSGVLSGVDLFLARAGTCGTSAPNLFVELRDVNTAFSPSQPGSNVFGTSNAVPFCTLPTAVTQTTFVFPAPPTVGLTTQYSIVLRSDVSLSPQSLTIGTSSTFPPNQHCTNGSGGVGGWTCTPQDLELNTYTNTGPSLDQKMETNDTVISWAGEPNRFAQTFTAGSTGLLSRVDFGVTSNGSGCAQGNQVLLDVYSVATATTAPPVPPPTPPPTPLATSNPIDMCSLTRKSGGGGGQSFSNFSFPATSTASVTAGLTYALVLRSTRQVSSTSMQVYADSANLYANGQEFTFKSSLQGWVSVASSDLMFRTYVGSSPPSNENAPTQVVTAGTSWSAVSAGDQHTCALDTNSKLFCWGLNDHNQSGNTPFSPFATPTQFGAATNWGAIDLGTAFGCGKQADGTAWCWGKNDLGQGGTAGGADLTTPTKVGTATDWSAVSAGVAHACGTENASGTITLSCWGDNTNGELGQGTSDSNPHSTPLPVTGHTWSDKNVSAGFQDSCAIDSAGAIWCWGLDQSAVKPAPARVDTRDFLSVVVGDQHSCALRSDGSAWCTGQNTNGQLGNGATLPAASVSVWTAAAVGKTFTSLNAGGNETCGVANDGTLWCWGQNDQGQLGNGLAGDQSTPQLVSGGFTDWSAVSVGKSPTGTHACALRTGGTLYCWGSAANGMLGVTLPACVGTGSCNTPQPVGSFAAVAAGGTQTCAISGGSLFCWGDNSLGQAGQISTVTSEALPTSVPGAWSAIAAGKQHSCGLQTNSLLCFGDNSFGQIGIGTAIGVQYQQPTPMTALTGYASLGPGEFHTCAIKTDGTLFCWGRNDASQLGTGDTSIQNSPFQIAAPSNNWLSVRGGLLHTCGVRSDGSLWCWGDDSVGQLGDNGLSRLSPVAVIDPATAPQATVAPSSTNSTISVSRASLPADGSATVITVIVRDGTNAAIANQAVALSVDGPTANTIFTVSSGVTDGAGAITASLSTTLVGTRVVTAAIGSFNLNATVLFTPGPATTTGSGVETVAVTGGPAGNPYGANFIAADGTHTGTVTVMAKDFQGHPLAGVPVTLSSTGTGRAFGQLTGFFDATGTFTTTISSSAAEVDTVTASMTQSTTTASVTFVGKAAKLAFVQQPSNVGTGSAITPAVTVAGKDVDNIIVTTDFFPVIAVNMTFGSNPGAATLGGTTTQMTASSGLASFGDLTVSQPGVGYTLVASSPALVAPATGATSSAFNVTAPWSQMGPYGGSINAVAIKDGSSAVMYAATAKGVFKSTSTGASWAPVTSGMGVRQVFALVHCVAGSASCASADILYAGTDNGVYKTTSGGGSWALANGSGSTSIPASTPVQRVIMGFSNTGRVYAVTASGVYMSDDSAGSWAKCSGLPAATSGYIALDPNNSTNVFFALADGTKVFWTNGNVGSSSCAFSDASYPGTNSATGILVSSDGSTVYVATASQGVKYTGVPKSSSVAWTQQGNNNLNQFAGGIRSITRDSKVDNKGHNQNNIYVGVDGGQVFKANQSIDSWSQTNSAASGMRNQSVAALLMDPNSSNLNTQGSCGGSCTLLAGQTNAGVFESTDSGNNFSSLSTGIPLAQITAIAVEPPSSGVTSTNTAFAAPLGLGIQVTTNANATPPTWSTTGTGLESVTKVFQIAFDKNGAAYAATDGGLFKSTDVGSTWGSPLISSQVTSVVVISGTDVNHATVYAANGSTVQKSVNNGAFSSFSSGLSGTVRTLAADAAGARLFAGTDTTIFTTLSAAAAWASAGTTNSTVTALAVDPLTVTNVYAGTAGAGVFKSTSATTPSFSAVNSGLTGNALSVTGIAVDTLTANRLWITTGVAGTAGAGAGVFRSNDGAATWNPATTGVPDLNTLSIALDPTTPLSLFVGTNSASGALATNGGL